MFKAGDIVTGTEDNHYGLTNSTVIMKVVEVGIGSNFHSEYNIKVKILSNRDGSKAEQEGHVFLVVSRKFELLQPRKIKRIT